MSVSALRTREHSIQASRSTRRPAPGHKPAPAPRPARPACGCRAGPACSWPWRNCHSCTVHSTSASPPRPSLTCVSGSAPRGSLSLSTRALIRRISVICSRFKPSAGYRTASANPMNPAPATPIPGTPAARAAAPAPPTPATTSRSSAGRRPGCAPAAPAGPRGAGRRRRPAADPAPARPAACAAARRRASAAASSCPRVEDEKHVGVGGVAHLGAAEAAHADDGEAHAPRALPAARAPQRRGQGGVGDVGQRDADRATRAAAPAPSSPARPSDVGAADPEQLTPAQRPDRGHRRGRVAPAGRGGAATVHKRLRANAGAARRRRPAAATLPGRG